MPEQTNHELPTPGDDYCQNCSLMQKFWDKVPICPAKEDSMNKNESELDDPEVEDDEEEEDEEEEES